MKCPYCGTEAKGDKCPKCLAAIKKPKVKEPKKEKKDGD